MKRILAVLAAVLCASIVLAATKIRSATIINSTLDSSPVGSVTPSTGVFSALTDTAFTPGNCIQVGGGGLLSTTANPCQNYGKTTTVCTTAASAFATCSSSVPLQFTQANTNYAAACSGVGPSGYPVIQGISKGTTSITVTHENGSSLAAVASTYSELDCVVVGP